MTDALLAKTLVLILASACTVGLMARVGSPAAVGYLLAGLIIGPHGLRLIAVTDETAFLAELGIIFLMFMVGLEFSLAAMIAARRAVFGAGSLQVGLTVLTVAAGVLFWGAGLAAAALIGGAVAMSSTAITLKQLAEQGDITSQHGQLVLGIILFQDLATIPLLVVLGTWGPGGGPQPLEALRQLAIAAVALGVAAFVCRPVFRAALTWVARTKSPELFLLAALLLALGTAFAGQVIGLAVPIGAFLAGMVIGESDFHHQVEDDIRPFRDVLLGLFFVAVGMEVNPSIVVAAPVAVLAWIMVFVPGKALIVLFTGMALRWPAPVTLRTAIILAHGGEDGLLLLTQAMKAGAVEPDLAQPALLALVASMALAPVFIQWNAWFSRLAGHALYLFDANTKEDTIRDQGQRLKEHVLLCGCGRIGRLVLRVLEAASIPYVAVEIDLNRFRREKQSGHNVVFGDASRKAILEAAGIGRARLVVITFSRRRGVERILHYLRQKDSAVPSIVSVADDQEVSLLAQAGARAVFPENLAAGLALADQVLLMFGLSRENAAKIVTTVRTELNPDLVGRVGV
jgi:monovalent cation:H+ antiporter-2, CPA2 family